MLNIYEIDGFKTKNNEVFAKYNIPENKIVLTNDLIDQAYFKLRGHKRYAYSKYYVNDELLYADGKAYNDYIYIDENFNYHETYPYNIIKYFKCGIIYVRDKFLMNAKGEIIYSLKDYDKVVFATNGFIKIASKEIDELAKSIRDFELILNSNGKVIGRYLRTSEILSNNIILVETFDNKTQLIQLKPYKILASGPHKCAEIIKKFADLKAKESNVASNIIHIN